MSDYPLSEVVLQPHLEDSVMVVALEGWIDSGFGAVNAMTSILESTDSETVATFDVDRLLDHRARRPIMNLVNGLITDLSWPTIEVRAGVDTAGNDVVMLVGAEPDFEWRAFTESVIDLARTFDCRMIVTLGAYPAPVAHTRPTSLSITTSSPELSSQLHGYVRGTLEVPAGIHAAIDVAANEAGIPTLGLWAQVPHYVSSMAYPAASVALIDGLHDVTQLSLDPASLENDVRATRVRLDELVAENVQHQTMVAQLEEMMDQGLGGPGVAPEFEFTDLPSGDEIAEELQAFLRDADEQ